MTLREWLIKHQGEYCYYAGIMGVPDPENKYIMKGEAWILPVEALELEVK